ncbi:hypothetical protein D1007_36139 [Hordeum vulgare]|nr:hypothetical protein D1007_36139 [Hordeum vulgare]
MNALRFCSVLVQTETAENHVATYARMYMWCVISRTIFADGSGKNAQWMWLKALTVFDNKFSWGSVALAYLYRQIWPTDQSLTRKTGPDRFNPGKTDSLSLHPDRIGKKNQPLRLALAVAPFALAPGDAWREVAEEQPGDEPDHGDGVLRIPTQSSSSAVVDDDVSAKRHRKLQPTRAAGPLATVPPTAAYYSLDEACHRSTREGGIGGCMLLLSVWSWERLLVGRPREVTFKAWDEHDNHVRLPTWAYKWDVVSEVTSDVNILYKQYTNDMDSLTAEKVEWQAYGVGESFGDAHTFQLNLICLQEKHLWLMCCPLICNWAVEFHLPHRALHQFGLFQGHSPEWVDTDAQLHRFDRRRLRKIKDWNKHHKKYVTMFEQSVEEAWSTAGTQRKEIKKQADETEAILETTHRGKKGESALRLFIKKQGQKLRRLSNILDCRDPEYSEPSRSGSSHRNTLDDSNTSGSRMDDGDITSTAHLEDDVFSPEVQDDMTLEAFQRSSYLLKPGRGFKRYTPEDYVNKEKKSVSEGSRMT